MDNFPVIQTSLHQKIKSEMTHSIYPNLLATIPSLVFIASMLVYKLSGHVSQTYLYAWFAVFLATTACQGALAIWFNKTKYHSRFEHLYSRLLIADVTIMGVLWGVAGVLFMPQDILGQSYLILIATFVAGGGLLYLSRFHLAGTMYTAGILLPLVASLVISFFSQAHHEIYFNMTVGLGCYWLLLMAVSYTSSKLFAENHRFQLENKSLLEDLSHTNGELEKYMCALRIEEESLFSTHKHESFQPAENAEALSYTDPVTGLDSPAMQAVRFFQARAFARRHHQSIAVFRININNFQTVKDQFGDEAANLLLKTVAVRLQYCKRETDSAARLGDNQFALVVTEVLLGHEITTVVNRIIKIFAEKTIIENSRVQIEASIGISLFSRDGDELTDLFRGAETALAAADADSNTNKLRYQIFNPATMAGQHTRTTDLNQVSL